MNERRSLSLTMIVRNEEQFLRGCLDSVRHLVDQISIVDTGSTDATVTIARAYGAEVSSFPWTGDFSEARNFALARCTGEWALYLDADERLATRQEALLSRLVGDLSAAAYQVHIRSGISLPAGCTVQVMAYPRLFRRTPGVRFEGAVHEQIAPSILRMGGRIRPSALVIEHLGYDQGYGVLKAKAERNMELLLRQTASNPDDWYARLQAAKTSLLLGDWKGARQHLAQCLRISDVPREHRASMHNLLAEIAFREDDADTAIGHCEASLELEPGQMGARWFLGGAHAKRGDLTQAVRVLSELRAIMKALEHAIPGSEVEDVVLSPVVVLLTLGKCYLALDEPGRGADCFLDALREDPLSADAISLLMQACARDRSVASASRRLEEAALLVPEQSPAAAALACGRFEQAFRAGQYASALAMVDALGPALSAGAREGLRDRLVRLVAASHPSVREEKLLGH